MIFLLVSLLLVLICLRFHCFVLCNSAIFIVKNKFDLSTSIMLFLVCAISAHIIEVFLYALTIYLNVEILDIGHLSGEFEKDLLAYFYFSIVSYTSLGLGDIWPHGPIRILVGIEALNGLILIACSASYIFLFMKKQLEDLTF